MKYMFLIYGSEKHDDQGRPRGDDGGLPRLQPRAGGAGLMQGGSQLAPVATATTVRVRDGKTTTTDGPFAETTEQFGGYYLVECKDLDEALKWAAPRPRAVRADARRARGARPRGAPSPIVALNRAVAIGMAAGPEAGLAALDTVGDELADYHLYPATRAELLARAGRPDEARAAFAAALALAKNARERAFLASRLEDVTRNRV